MSEGIEEVEVVDEEDGEDDAAEDEGAVFFECGLGG
jgi:hypothetical protein